MTMVWTGNESMRKLLAPVDGLHTHPKNPRKGNVEVIRSSLTRFGQQRPILALPDGTIVAGNHTYRAAVAEGWTHIAVVRSDLPEAEIEAYLLADNRTSDLGTYDDSQLAALLKPYYEQDALLGTGYDANLVERMLRQDAKANADDVPLPPTDVKSKPGEVYELGPHRLMCGDSSEQTQVDLLLGGELAKFAMADPPYNVGYHGGATSAPRADSYADVRNDYAEWLGRILLASNHGTDAKAALHLWFAMNEIRNVMAALDAGGWDYRTMILWCKENRHTGSGFSQYKPDYEPCIYGHKHGKSPRFYGAAATWATVFYPQPSVNDLHPTMKPVQLYADLMGNHTRKGDLVLESFGGSGTTLIAAEMTGRVARLMEISPSYCDVIRQRYADFVGDQSFAPT